MRPATKLIPILLFTVLTAAIVFVPSSAAAEASMERIDDHTYVFTSDGPGLWKFGDGSSEYAKKGGKISHTFPSGRFTVSFISSDLTQEFSVDAYDRQPILVAYTDNEYRCCLFDAVDAKAYDGEGNAAGWLAWDEGTSAIVGTPTSTGTYLVVFHYSDGKTTMAYDLVVTEGTPSQGSFSITVGSDGMNVHGETSVSLSGRFVEWSIYDLNGNRVAVSNHPILDVKLNTPGTYCVVVTTTLGTPTLTASDLVIVEDPDEPKDDLTVNMMIIAGAAVILLIVIRRLL